jgi:hypothetical protein
VFERATGSDVIGGFIAQAIEGLSPGSPKMKPMPFSSHHAITSGRL